MVTKRKRPTIAATKKGIQALANRYCRLRDTRGDGAACISCGQWFQHDYLQGGHFMPTTVSSIRFDERNIHAQCVTCNLYLHGNQAKYFAGLEQKLGREVVNELLEAPRAYKWTRQELEDIGNYYKAKLKEIGF